MGSSPQIQRRAARLHHLARSPARVGSTSITGEDGDAITGLEMQRMNDECRRASVFDSAFAIHHSAYKNKRSPGRIRGFNRKPPVGTNGGGGNRTPVPRRPKWQPL